MTTYENFQERTIAFNWIILVFFTTLAFVLFLFYLKHFYPEYDTNLNYAIAMVSMIGFLYCIYLISYLSGDGEKLAKGVYKNAQGQLVNAQGQLVNAQGQLVNAQGKLVNAQGQLVNAKGQLVNAQGKLVNSQGQLVNEKGELVNANGETINANGETINAKGEIINANQYTTYSPNLMSSLTPTPYNSSNVGGGGGGGGSGPQNIGYYKPTRIDETILQENGWSYDTNNILVNNEGQPINDRGQPINELGQTINANGEAINELGQRIDEYGNVLDQNVIDNSPSASESSSSLFLSNLMNAMGSSENASQIALGKLPKLVFGEIYLSDNKRNVIIIKGQYSFNFYLLHSSKDVFTSYDGINFTDTNNPKMKAVVVNNGPPSYLGETINGKGIKIVVTNADSTTSDYYFYSSDFSPSLVQGDSFISVNLGQSNIYVNDTNAFDLLDKASKILASYTSIDGINFSISSLNNCSQNQNNQFAQFSQYNKATVMVEQDSTTAISSNINTLGQCIRLTNTSDNTSIYYYWNYNKLDSTASNTQTSSNLDKSASNTPYFSCMDPLSVVQYTIKNNQSPDILTKLNTCSKQQLTDTYSLYKIMYPNTETFSNRKEGFEVVQNPSPDEANAGKVIAKAIGDTSSSQNSGNSISQQPSITTTSAPIFDYINRLSGSTYTSTSYAPIITDTPVTNYTSYTPITTSAAPLTNYTSYTPITTTLTSAAPIITTSAAPVFTSAAPIITTTAAPVFTSAEPVFTTAAPVFTSAAPIITTAAPIITTAAPIITTAATSPTMILYYPFNVDVLNYATGTGVVNGSIIGTTVSIDNSSYITGSGSLKQSRAVSYSSYFKIETIPANTQGYTFAFWLNFKSDYSSVNVFNFDNNKIKIYTLSGTIYLYFGGVNLGIGGNFKNADYINKWNHYVWTIDKNGNTTLYLNGTLFFQKVGGYTYFSETMNNNFILGGGYSIQGNVDDFRYYDGILPQEQITDIYNIRNPSSL